MMNLKTSLLLCCMLVYSHSKAIGKRRGASAHEAEEVVTEYEINQRNGFFESDGIIFNDEPKARARRGIGRTVTIWPKVNGELVIPYKIDDSIALNSELNTKILGFIASMNEVITCNKNVWRERTDQEHYILFKISDGCQSYIGYIPYDSYQPQAIQLSEGCINYGAITHHEMMHAMGFYHEQSRQDRDLYVKINEENIKDGFGGNFKKADTKDLGSPYDFGSIMHYSATTFSKNGLKTIEKLDQTNTEVMGQRKSMSAHDIHQLNTLYGCPTSTAATTSSTTTSTTTTTPGTTTTTTAPITTTSTTTTTPSTTPSTTISTTTTIPSTTPSTTTPTTTTIPSTTPSTTTPTTTTTPSTTPSTTTSTPSTTLSTTITIPSTTSSTPSTTSVAPSKCPDTICRHVSYLLFVAVPNDLNRFVVCWSGLSFGCYICPVGHRFNQVHQSCDIY